MKPRIGHTGSEPTQCASRTAGGVPIPCRRLAVRTFARATPSPSSPPPSAPSGGIRRVILYDLHDVVVPYERAWQWQKALVDRVVAEAAETARTGETSTTSTSMGYAILLQHEPVYTLGEGSTTDHLKFNMDEPPHPIHRIERGGEVTYHGPGQLVMYPILNLRMLQPDLHWYLRQLEEMIIYSLETVSGIEAGRIDGLTGVWVDNRKIAAIGIRATKWVSYHGIALNVTTDLAPFGYIVPCGIKDEDKKVTSVALEVGGDDRYLLDEHAEGLIEGLREVVLGGVDVKVVCGVSATGALDKFLEEKPKQFPHVS